MRIVDFHAHVLPKADHGSDSLNTSLAQLKLAESAGVSDIFATPHFYVDDNTIEKFLSRREYCYNVLKEAAEAENINIRLHKSAEVKLVLGLTKLPDLDKLCIENTNCMLLEMPFNHPWQPWVYAAVDELRDRGIEPILAHIERYDKTSLERIFDYDVKTQINAESLYSGFFMRRRILGYVNDGLVHFIGSDIHMKGNQYDFLNKSVRVLGKQKIREFSENALKILR